MFVYHNNHLATPEVVTDQSGSIVWKADYKPFGKAEIDPASTITNDFRFPGQTFDSETGYHYNWNRYYDPETGRYLTADPIGIKKGTNHLYNYVGGDPVNAIDPRGLDAWSGVTDSIGGFALFGGASYSYGSISNWKTGETCNVEITCYNLGVGLTAGLTASSLWVPNGPSCGKDLSGVSIGCGLEGGWGAYADVGPGGSAGVSADGTTGISLGAGVGAGMAMYASHCTTNITGCYNTPCKCK